MADRIRYSYAYRWCIGRLDKDIGVSCLFFFHHSACTHSIKDTDFIVPPAPSVGTASRNSGKCTFLTVMFIRFKYQYLSSLKLVFGLCLLYIQVLFPSRCWLAASVALGFPCCHKGKSLFSLWPLKIIPGLWTLCYQNVVKSTHPKALIPKPGNSRSWISSLSTQTKSSRKDKYL